VKGLRLATERGLLWFADWHEQRAWIVTDSRRINGQARRLDGKPWQELDGAKAWTFARSLTSWPIGAREAEPYPNIALCEGSPDLLAAHHYIYQEGKENTWGAVTILGSRNKIFVDALPAFEGITREDQKDTGGRNGKEYRLL